MTLLAWAEVPTKGVHRVVEAVSPATAEVQEEFYLHSQMNTRNGTGVAAAGLEEGHLKVGGPLACDQTTERNTAALVMANVAAASNVGEVGAWGTPDQPRSCDMNLLHFHTVARPPFSSYGCFLSRCQIVLDVRNRMILLYGLCVRGLPEWVQAANVTSPTRSCSASEKFVVVKVQAVSSPRSEDSGCTRLQSSRIE